MNTLFVCLFVFLLLFYFLHCHSQVDRYESAFIWTYRKDYLHGLMTRKHLSWIQTMDVRWEELASKREHILEEISVVYSVVGSDVVPDERVR